MLNSQSMLGIEDQRCNALFGGRGTRYDPRPALAKLQSGTKGEMVWGELPDEPDQKGEASYAFVPHLLRFYREPREQPTANGNVYAILATIEQALKRGNSPDVPT